MLPGKALQTKGIIMDKIIKFLTDCYAYAIVTSFCASLVVWLGIVFMCILGVYMVEEWEQWQALVGAITIVSIFTVIEIILVIALGASAVLIEILNSIQRLK